MAQIGFIGLGTMGLPMASALLAVGHRVCGYDLREVARSRLATAGGIPCGDAASAVAGAQLVFTCLTDAQAVRRLYLESNEVLGTIRRGTVLVDLTSMGLDEARQLASALDTAGHVYLEAPVLGEPRDVRARQLTLCVAGSSAAFLEAKPVLEDLAERVVFVGKPGMGQAALLLAQLMTTINLLGVAEAFALGERLGVPAEKLFEISALSSATSWALVDRCPQSGLVPDAPSNNLYQGGLAAKQVLGQLRLLENSAAKADARIPLTTLAADLYAEFADTRDPRLDFSAIIQILRRR